MPLIEIGGAPPEMRRRYDEVLGIRTGPSRRGSTYWRRYFLCPRHHFLANVVRWEPSYLPDHLTRGLMFHRALEHYYERLQQWQESYPVENRPAALVAAGKPLLLDFFRPLAGEGEKAAFESLQPFAGEPGYTDLYATVERMVAAYFKRWVLDKWEIVGVEVTIESQYRAGFEYSTRLDLLIIDWTTQSHPMLRIVEHKSTAWIDAYILEGYTQDLQTLGQVWLVVNELDLSQYPTFVGSWVNICSAQKEPVCDRVPVQPSFEALDNWASSVRSWQALQPIFEKLGWPQNFANCTDRYGRCPFFDLCRLYPQLRPAELASLSEPIHGYFRLDDKVHLAVTP